MADSDKDDWARRNKFLVLRPGEAYERRLGKSRSLFIYVLDTGRWLLVNANFHRDTKGNEYNDVKLPREMTTDGTTWKMCVESYTGYMDWRQRNGVR